MQKLIGSVFVILACSAIGFEKSGGLQQRVKELEELKKIFTMLKSELEYTKAPFSEVFMKISQKTQGIFRVWLGELAVNLEKRQDGTLSELWIASITKYFEKSFLREDEVEELQGLGNGLIYGERIELYINQLEIAIQYAREEMASKKKLYQSMGVMGGLFLVIILL